MDYLRETVWGEQHPSKHLITDVEFFRARELHATYVQKKFYKPSDFVPDEEENKLGVGNPCSTRKPLQRDSKNGSIVFVELDFHFLAPTQGHAEDKFAGLVRELVPNRRIDHF